MTKNFRSSSVFGFLPLLGSSFALVACATSPANATPAQMVQIHHACESTMGLNPADTDYDLCTRSLMQTVSQLDQANATQRDRKACAQQGLKAGSSDFALCVLNAEQSKTY